MSQATATVNGQVIARAHKWETVEGNVYFPPSSVNTEYLSKTSLHTSCPWKGTSSYYTINVDGLELKDAAWYYPEPKEKAANIKDHVAFNKGKVQISVS